MSPQPPSSIEIEFAERCDREHARVCGDTHPPGLRRRLASWRDEWLVRRALKVAGEPGLVLDLACGAGRGCDRALWSFWLGQNHLPALYCRA